MLIHKIEKTHFSPSESIIIDYILKKGKDIKNMTIAQIANETYTSSPLFIRIAKKLGFDGWNEFKEAYLKELDYLYLNQEVDANIPFVVNDDIMNIAYNLCVLERETIQDTYSLISHDDLQKAVQIIRKASSIYVFAVSNNGLISQEFAHNMSRIQKKVTICHLQGELVYSAMNAEPHSCAIIVSYSGETPILSRVIQALKANGIPIIALTNIGENTVSKHADVVLRICTREKLYSKIATFSTDISFEYILDLLYSCIFALNYDQNVERKTKISSMIEKGRFSTIDIMKEDEF